MNRVRFTRDNNGATLVMVIIAMMFVGIIAAIALTITVGNSKSTKTTIDTSSNFYSSENVLNDLEMYLKKLATGAATQAYEDTLDFIGTSVDVDAKFEELFAEEIEKSLKAKFSNIETGNYDANLAKLQEICFNRYGLTDDYDDTSDPTTIPVKISIGNMVKENGKIVLKNVVITLKQDGYESTITTDITFNARMPETGKLDSSDDFTYEIDHFLAIAGRDIVSNGYNSVTSNPGKMYGEYIGNLYAYNDLVIQTNDYAAEDTEKTNSAVKIKSNYIIVGDDIIVDKGTSVSGNGSASFSPIDKNRIISKIGTAYGTNIWADNFKVYDGSVKLYGIQSKDLAVDTFLGGNLELNGNNSEFIFASGNGKFTGYSYKSVTNNMITSTVAPKSSAIILNGLGAKLDLSRLTSLKLSGTAYTAISDLQNVEKVYSSYNDTTNLNYYTQGESITYRALQALYLVPGDCIKVVGHNPMTVQDVLDATGKTNVSDVNLYGLEITIPENIKAFVNINDPYVAQYVRYVGSGSMKGEDKVYLFWNFTDKTKAVDYFDKIIKTDTLYFSGSGLSEKQIKMLTDKSGYIELPSADKCDLYGNGIYYNSGLKSISGKKTITESLDNKFGSLKSYITTSKTDNGKSLLVNMFPNDRLSTVAGGAQDSYKLTGPLDNRYDAEHNLQTYTIKDTTAYKDDSGNLMPNQIKYTDETDTTYLLNKTYILVTGDNIDTQYIRSEHWNTDYTYIFVTPGNVKFSAKFNNFRCLIIAGGDISLPEGMNMECLGMLSYVNDAEPDKQIDTTEFRALLDVAIYKENGEEDPTTGNFKLREIFNVADTSATGGSGNGDDFVTITTSEWKRN